MNDNENRRLQMFLGVQGFGLDRTADFAAGSVGQQLLQSLGLIITEIEGHAASEVSAKGASRQGTTTRSEARAALREDLEAINRTARAIAADVPGLNDKFRLPRGNNDQQLLSAARAFAADALPIKAQFIAHELPADFLEDLADDIAAMETTMADQATGQSQRIASAAAIDDAIDRGNEVVRKLDAIVKNKYGNQPAVRAAWLSASHTERAPRRRRGTEEDANAGGGTSGGGGGSGAGGTGTSGTGTGGTGTGGTSGSGGGGGGSSPPTL